MFKKLYGKKYFDNKIDVTDPCYDSNVWCRNTIVDIIPGEYFCITEEEENGLVNKIAIVHKYFMGALDEENPEEDFKDIFDELEFEFITNIGVDAGLAGFFNNKKDFTDNEWTNFCKKISQSKEKAWIAHDGFFSSSGLGDGLYSIYAHHSKDGINMLYIDFSI